MVLFIKKRGQGHSALCTKGAWRIHFFRLSGAWNKRRIVRLRLNQDQEGKGAAQVPHLRAVNTVLVVESSTGRWTLLARKVPLFSLNVNPNLKKGINNLLLLITNWRNMNAGGKQIIENQIIEILNYINVLWDINTYRVSRFGVTKIKVLYFAPNLTGL